MAFVDCNENRIYLLQVRWLVVQTCWPEMQRIRLPDPSLVVLACSRIHLKERRLQLCLDHLQHQLCTWKQIILKLEQESIKGFILHARLNFSSGISEVIVFSTYYKKIYNISYQAARVRAAPPRKHMGAMTAPMMPVCTIQANCLAPNPGV